MSSDALPAPLVPGDVDLRDFQFMPLDVRRLLTSETWLTCTGDEKSAAVTLWLESWHQVPAGSLPNNDKMLAVLSQAGARWRKVREAALRGWVECSDGRIYHRVVCEKALEAWEKKAAQRERGRRGNAARWGKGSQKDGEADRTSNPSGIAQAVAEGSHKDASAILTRSPKDRKGQGQGQGQGEKKDPEGGGTEPRAREPDSAPSAEVDMPPIPKGLDRRPKPGHGIVWPVPEVPPPWAAYEAEMRRLPAERLAEVYAGWVNDRLAKGLTPFDPVADWRSWLIREEKFEREREAKRRDGDPKPGESRWAI